MRSLHTVEENISIQGNNSRSSLGFILRFSTSIQFNAFHVFYFFMFVKTAFHVTVSILSWDQILKQHLTLNSQWLPSALQLLRQNLAVRPRMFLSHILLGSLPQLGIACSLLCLDTECEESFIIQICKL